MAGRRKRRETNPFYVIFNDWNNVGEMIINGTLILTSFLYDIESVFIV